MQKLFIDIDDTLVRYRDGAPGRFDQPLLGHDLFSWIAQWAQQHTGADEQQVEQVIRAVHKEKIWWDWDDYLEGLGLPVDAFWTFALAQESRYLEPTHPELPRVMQRLRDADYVLYITSNNPVSGIRHKLRLAGLGGFLADDGFAGLLGTNVVRAMKWAPSFWSKAMQLAGVQADQVTTIGDTWHDDILAPCEAGIHSRIFLGKPGHRSLETQGEVHFAQSWDQIEQLLLNPASPRVAHPLPSGQLRRSI